VAVAKAKAKERERPQITVATVIQKPGEDVKKKGVPKPNMKDKKSKESQVLDVLKQYMPDDKVRLAMFHELMPIMREGGTHRERKKKIVVKREKEAVVNVEVAEEAQKAVDTAVIAVETAVIAADEAESAEAAATQKVAEEAVIECEECGALSVVTATAKVCDECLWVTAAVVVKAAQEKTASIAAETAVIAADEAVIAAEKAAEEVERERRLKQETDTVAEKAVQNVFEELVAEIAAEAAKEEREERWRAVKVPKKTAAIVVETAVIATQKVAEEVTIECEKCNTLSIAEAVTSKVGNDCLWTAVVVKDRFVQKAHCAECRLDRSRRAREARELADDDSDWMHEHNNRDCPCHFDADDYDGRYCDRCEAKTYQEHYYYNVVVPWRELCR